MNMTIQNHARKNWAVKEVFFALLGIFWGIQVVIQGPLKKKGFIYEEC